MAYLNPRYNGKVGLYPGNKIERFGTVSQNQFSAGDFVCIKFTPTNTIKSSPASEFAITGASWSGATYFYQAVAPSNSFIKESSSSPILVNTTVATLSPGNSLFTVSTVSSTPVIGTQYWFVFQVATGCTITLAAGSNITYNSTSSYVETLKDNSYLSITY